MSIDSVKIGDVFKIKEKYKKIEYTSKSEKFITDKDEEVRFSVGRIIGTSSVVVDPEKFAECEFIAPYTQKLNNRFNRRMKLCTITPFHPEIGLRTQYILVDDYDILEKVRREIDYRNLPEATPYKPIDRWDIFGHENIATMRYLAGIAGENRVAQLEFVRTHKHLPATKDLGKFWILQNLGEFVCGCGKRLDSSKTKIRPISSVYITKVRKILAHMVSGGFLLQGGSRAKLIPHIIVCPKCNDFSVVAVETDEDELYFVGAHIGPLKEYKKAAKNFPARKKKPARPPSRKENNI